MRKLSQPNEGGRAPAHPVLHRAGTLFVVGVPLGHPDDLSRRAIHTLKRVAIVAAEAPLLTRKLLDHHRIEATVTSYGPVGLKEKIAVLLQRLHAGLNVALLSDSGMPVIHDPGQQMVHAAHRSGITVKVIPGPSAVTAAIACSGYAGDAFVFEGRLSVSRPALQRLLKRVKGERRTTVLFVERPVLARVLNGLADLRARRLTVCAGITSPDEMILRGTARQVLSRIPWLPDDLEITLVIQGRKRD